MAAPAMRTRRWKRVEYGRLVEAGLFHDERLELLHGQLVVREPQASRHVTGIRPVEEALRSGFGQGWEIRVQFPVGLDDDSEPEPDVAVMPGGPRDYRDGHPSRPVLVGRGGGVEPPRRPADTDEPLRARGRRGLLDPESPRGCPRGPPRSGAIVPSAARVERLDGAAARLHHHRGNPGGPLSAHRRRRSAPLTSAPRRPGGEY